MVWRRAELGAAVGLGAPLSSAGVAEGLPRVLRSFSALDPDSLDPTQLIPQTSSVGLPRQAVGRCPLLSKLTGQQRGAARRADPGEGDVGRVLCLLTVPSWHVSAPPGLASSSVRGTSSLCLLQVRAGLCDRPCGVRKAAVPSEGELLPSLPTVRGK